MAAMVIRERRLLRQTFPYALGLPIFMVGVMHRQTLKYAN